MKILFASITNQSTSMLLHSLPRNNPLPDENINQPLQRLHVLSAQQIIVHGNSDKVHETTVQLQVSVDVPERVLPMTVVQVGVAAEHLLDDASDIGVEVGWETGGFADPIVLLT